MKNFLSKRRRLTLNFLEKYFVRRLERTYLFWLYEVFLFIVFGKFLRRSLFSRRQDSLFFIYTENSEKFYFFNRSRVRRYISAGGFNTFCEKLLRKYIFVSMPLDFEVIFDIGTNIGEFSYNFVNTKTVCHCFEIDPLTLSVLKLNLGDKSNFFINDFAVSDKTGTSNFYLDSLHASSSLLKNESLPSIQVATITLDDYIEARGLDRIDFIKIEAEGAEPEILKGFVKNILKVNCIAIDCTPERYGESTLNECTAHLVENNFTCHVSGYYLFAFNNGKSEL